MLHFAIAIIFTSLLAGCAQYQKKESEPAPVAKVETAAEKAIDSLYEVHKDGRIYVFGDHELYRDFIKTGHTAYMKNYIGEGPKGETLVFGLTGKEKKMASGWKHVDLFKGARSAGENFYGEMMAEGRIHVFSSYEDMSAVRKIGEAPYRFTEIGAGPAGETVVYVLNKTNKKNRPEALIALFGEMNK